MRSVVTAASLGRSGSPSPMGGVWSVTCASSRRRFRAGAGARRRRAPPSDVQEPHVLGVPLDEGPAGLHVLAHEYREDLVRRRGVVQGDLEQRPVVGVHGGVPPVSYTHLTLPT